MIQTAVTSQYLGRPGVTYAWHGAEQRQYKLRLREVTEISPMLSVEGIKLDPLMILA